jgi:hypothetical protein
MRFYTTLIIVFFISVSAQAQSVFQFTAVNNTVNEADGISIGRIS